MRIVVLPGVLRPPSDAALLCRVMARHELAGRSVLDLCTGTGIVGLTAARLGADATAIDLSRRPVALERLDSLRSIGVADESLSERMVVVEGRRSVRSRVREPVL